MTATVCHRPVAAATTRASDGRTCRRPWPCDRHDAGGDGSEALGRVDAVGLDVEGVVPQVDAAGGEAERDEGEQRPARSAGRRAPRRRRARRNQDVLHPLPGRAVRTSPWTPATSRRRPGDGVAGPAPRRRGRRRPAARGHRRVAVGPDLDGSAAAVVLVEPGVEAPTFAGPGSCRRAAPRCSGRRPRRARWRSPRRRRGVGERRR